ncbi:MAG: CHAT domain-containing protein [Burkholderiaceae bacterium]
MDIGSASDVGLRLEELGDAIRRHHATAPARTGVGQVRSGSGVMRLPLALMIAGNRNAVITLWRVPDASAAAFVERLFKQLKTGTPPANALAITKREMARNRLYSHPIHWAGFVVYGAQ